MNLNASDHNVHVFVSFAVLCEYSFTGTYFIDAVVCVLTEMSAAKGGRAAEIAANEYPSTL